MPITSWEQTIATFGDLIRQGKIREWALSNVRAWHIPHIVHLCRQMGVPQPVALQPYYNLMNRQPETELLPAAKFFDLGVVPYSPLARGVLTGKYKVNQVAEPGSRAARQDKRMLEAEWRPESLMIAEKLKAHAEARGITLVHWATAWVLNNRAVTSTIAGPAHASSNGPATSARSTTSGRRRTRRLPTAWCRRAIPRRPASPIRPTLSKAAFPVIG